MKKITFLLMAIIVMVSLAGCSENHQGKRSQEIRISAQNNEEQMILTHLASILLTEKTDHEVVLVKDEEATSKSLYSDLQNRNIDIYFDYSGSIYFNALDLPESKMQYAVLLVQLQSLLLEKGVFISESLGYDGGLTLFITPELREKLGEPANISELRDKAPQLIIAMEDSFYQRQGGYKALLDTYNLKFKEAKVYNEADGFFALRRGEVDIMVGLRTSVYNNMYNLYLLKDDKRLFIPQTACYVADDELLLAYPEIKDTLNLMNDLLTSGTVSAIIRKVYWEGNDLEEYLRSFLRARNLL